MKTLLIVSAVAWVVWLLVRGLYRWYDKPTTELVRSDVMPVRAITPYLLKSRSFEGRSVTEPLHNLLDMPLPTSRLFTYRDECRAATARQRLWMRYEDRTGQVTERIVEIYHPEDDEVVFTWCCLKREPRTFARRNIQSWRLLQEQFLFDPIVARYWDEEGTRDLSEKLPWRRWLSMQAPEIAERYQ
jgi:hypothetical protein